MGNKVIIKVVLKTEAPLSIKMPTAEGQGKPEYEGFPVMTRGVDSDGKPQKTVFLPATTLRGFFRRAITLRSMRKAADAGSPYRLPQVYAEMIGQDADSEKQSDQIDLLELKKAREASPVLDLFGSGLGIKSRLKVSHFVPPVNVLPEPYTGVRKDLDDTEDALDLMNQEDMKFFIGRSESNNRRAAAAAVVKQLEGKIRRDERKGIVSEDDTKGLEGARAALQKFKDEMGEMQVSTRTIVTHYAMPAGLELHGRIVIDKFTDKDVEMLEYALNELSLSPVLGAHSARGCGEISGVFEFADSSGRQFKSVSIGGYKHATVTNF